MNLTTYRAYTMAEALAAVKRDMGSNATIVHTRTFQRGGFLGIGRQTIVEVTASRGHFSGRTRSTKPAVAPQRVTRAGEARKAYRSAPPVDTPLPESLEEKKQHLIETIASNRPKQPSRPPRERPSPEEVPTTPIVHADRRRCLLIRESNDTGASAGRIRTGAPNSSAAIGDGGRDGAAPVARRFILKPAGSTGHPLSVGPHGSSDTGRNDGDVAGGHVSRNQVESVSVGGAQEEIRAIKGMVSQILQKQTRQSGRAAAEAMPQRLFDMYLKLIGQDLSEELADSIVAEIQRELSADELDDERTVRAALARHLASIIPTADEPIATLPREGRPFTLALIGPTGVGKTTTVAKLAATFKLTQKRRVGLVTSDTYRIAAVEQLRTYANIIGLPLNVVLTPAEMRQACHQMRDCDVILIDTAGRSQRDRGRLDELDAFIRAADPHEVHLVLSSTTSERVLLDEAESFASVRADKIIFTKLDEAVSFGMLINVIRKVGKELSFFTTGQEVPEHIERGRAERLAELVLGGELRRA